MKKTLFIISIALLLSALLVVLSPFLAIVLENVFVMLEINNPYVNSFYADWQSVSISGFSGFLIPSGWSIYNEDGLYTIQDALGQTWAYGATFGAGEARFSGFDALIEEVLSVDAAEVIKDPFIPFLMMDGSDIDKLIVQKDSSTAEYYSIQMFETTQTEIVWLLMVDISADETQYDIAEAIVYSYAFEIGK